MDKGFRLFERIELGEPKSCYQKVTTSKTALDSIRLHLVELLNTHIGNAMIAHDYGLPDFNDVLSTNANLIHSIQSSICHVIEKFEPRLSAIHVHYKKDTFNPLQLSFGISGEVIHNGNKLPTSINVYMGVDGQFEV
ncbi:type VI secretion system baseplate subunit TssE [Vibrio sp. S4M6]|uniref:type VI secretion system baseplate subunit TssE n=1 Tax=Vibrio sinus TaxID=2946865 RepID=UPI00202A999E|nr:type VI secretion system baseplate subunit TssE [Vibrio sinus]MCL9783488.1 type VI secretion system baseplate subunit TssE [Vibrio sinus]